MSRLEKVVICFFADDAAFARVKSACAEEGLRAVRSTQGDGSDLVDIVAMIHDLECSEPSTPLEAVQRFRQLHPRRPILLYCRASKATAGLVGRIGSLPGVAACIQTAHLPDERIVFGRLMRELISQTPQFAVRSLINAVRPSAGAAVDGFVDALLDRLEEGGEGVPLVSIVAARAGLRSWVVWRACHSAGLPAPERLIAWIILIYVIALAESDGQSIARAAAKVGVSDKYIRQLRASLLPDVLRLTRAVARHALTHAVVRFAEVCGLSPHRAASVAQGIVA
jgi:hypothetical protein